MTHPIPDPLFDDAVQTVRKHHMASIELIKRTFGIPHSRSSTILSQLETAQVIGPHNGSKPRAVL